MKKSLILAAVLSLAVSAAATADHSPADPAKDGEVRAGNPGISTIQPVAGTGTDGAAPYNVDVAQETDDTLDDALDILEGNDDGPIMEPGERVPCG